MKKLLSLPPNLVACFHDITDCDRSEWFCTSDPVGHKLGSGGGTAWLLWRAFLEERGEKKEEKGRKKEENGETREESDLHSEFSQWLSGEKRILLHAGGQSRRLPAYAPSGKILTPVPVFRWERGQKLSQNLLSLQLPLYERIMQAAPARLRTMVVSGDVYIRATQPLQPIPEADVVCYGLWLGPEVASHHGVFVSERRSPSRLKCMLQKPSAEVLGQLLKDHFYLTDIGVWLLSDRAVEVLMRKTASENHDGPSEPFCPYDLYGEFGCALGTHPTTADAEVNGLSVAVLPLPGGEFYHFGTSRELLASMLAIQNQVTDQRQIMHHDRKPHPSIFVQNAITDIKFTSQNTNIWIENSHVGAKWKLTHDHIITGVPRNDWEVSLEPGECIDVVPVGESDYEVRRYHIDDRVDSDELSLRANLRRLFDQRRSYRAQNWTAMARNHQHSVFYQIDLEDAAREFAEFSLPMPPQLTADAPLLTRVRDNMFRSEVVRRQGGNPEAYEGQAFSLLRQGITETATACVQQPRMSVYSDQIVWGRSPVRIDIAGGWTDTPPFCLMEGGNVINLAIELNGQQPLQAYVRPCRERHIVLRSIDLGAAERVETYEQLADFRRVGSPFSIPKAALCLAGFLPAYSAEQYGSLRQQLEAFGCGIELTLLSAIPAGSGLGTSSLLAATVLGALSDFCGLAWDKNEVGHRTLVLEQMLTTGGGWQDQFGGLLQGVKLLQTEAGFAQNPVVRWLPNDLWLQPEYAACHLLYYTGITRTAKAILAEIVRRMFLNQHDQLMLLRQMKAHAMDMYDAIQRNHFTEMGRLIRKTWQQNQQLDSGTNPAAISAITTLIDDLCLGYKLPGAGGGGYLYMVAKDPEAAARIRQLLAEHALHSNARFVEMTLSTQGMQVSRS